MHKILMTARLEQKAEAKAKGEANPLNSCV